MDPCHLGGRPRFHSQHLASSWSTSCLCRNLEEITGIWEHCLCLSVSAYQIIIKYLKFVSSFRSNNLGIAGISFYNMQKICIIKSMHEFQNFFCNQIILHVYFHISVNFLKCLCTATLGVRDATHEFGGAQFSSC